MKKDVVDYIGRHIECQRVKVKHEHPTCFLQPFPIPKWKWEVVTIYFIIKLPRTLKKHHSIMVVVDNLTKASNFIPVKMTHKTTNIAKVYMKSISRLHGVPKETVSNQDSKFPSNFWKGLFKGFATNLNLSTTYHPQTYG